MYQPNGKGRTNDILDRLLQTLSRNVGCPRRACFRGLCEGSCVRSRRFRWRHLHALTRRLLVQSLRNPGRSSYRRRRHSHFVPDFECGLGREQQR